MGKINTFCTPKCEYKHSLMCPWPAASPPSEHAGKGGESDVYAVTAGAQWGQTPRALKNCKSASLNST